MTADRAGLHVVELHDLAEQRAASSLFGRVWHVDRSEQIVAVDLIRAFAHSGNCVLGAYLDDRLVGALVGFFGANHLHSHVMGVNPAVQGRGVGYVLKQHQRSWALARGIVEVHWTFDPLVRRNAHFNLRKLGALPSAYLTSFYGPLDDGINAGDESDRLYLVWDLTRPWPPTVDPDDVVAGAQVIVECRDDRPIVTPDPWTGRYPLLVAVPPDVEALRTRDPALAATWRTAVREALTAAMAAGYRVTGLTRGGSYVLERP